MFGLCRKKFTTLSKNLHRVNVKSERYRRKQNIKIKGSESSAQLAGQFMVRHAPQYLAIIKNYCNYRNGHLALLVIHREKLELLELRISWECLGSCLAVSLDIRYYNRQTTYQTHCKKKVLQLVKVHKSFTWIHWANHW